MAVVSLLIGACSSTPGPTLPSASAASSAEAAQELGAVPWYSAARAWDAQEVQQPAFNLAAGWIGEEDPTLSAVIPMAFGIEVLDMVRAPAVAMNGAGLIVYVSDDGTSSELHHASVDGGDDVVAELPEVVWSLALTLAGDFAYLNFLERKTGSDMGVWRVAIPNGPDARRVMPPAVEPLGGLVPAATIPYQAHLVVSDDGSFVARHSCGGPGMAFRCIIDVLDVATGAVRRIDEDTIGRLVGVAGHWLVGVLSCAEVGCPTVIVDLETGESTQLPPALDGLALTTVGGEAALAMTSATRDVHSFAIDVRSLADGQTETVLRTPADRPLYLGAGVWWEPVLPGDWVEIGFDHPNWRGAFALRVTDGLIVQLPAPNIAPPHPQPVPAGPVTNG